MILGLSPLAIGVALLGGYLLGSIPFGVVFTRLGGAGDVRAIGSGSIGATNVLRTGRRDLALATVIADGGKGAVAVLLARWWFGEEAGLIAGGAAFVGHLFPVWLGFRGGKGVATFFGTLLAVAWPLCLIAGGTWIAVAALLRWSSLAGLAAAGLAPLYAFLLREPKGVVVLAAFMAVPIFIRHEANIRRLLAGSEPRIGAKTAAPIPGPTP